LILLFPWDPVNFFRPVFCLFYFVASLLSVNASAATAPNYPDGCRQAGGSDVCRPPTVDPLRYGYLAMDLGMGNLDQPFDGFASMSAAQEHYAESYFGTEVCGSEWSVKEDWAPVDPYSDQAVYRATISSGGSWQKESKAHCKRYAACRKARTNLGRF